MACLDYPWLGKLVYDWQTLIAGLLAVAGGVIAYCAGVKQANATLKGAALQSQATAAQTAAIEQQNADLRRADQRRLARETLTAARMLDAALEVVANDIQNARSRFSGPRHGPVPLPTAQDVRRSVGKPGFGYLWEKLGALDREIAVPFLNLEAAIDRLRAEERATHVGGLLDRLDHLSLLVERLRDLAGGEIRRTSAILSDEEPSPRNANRLS